jgi:hypothetical protein
MSLSFRTFSAALRRIPHRRVIGAGALVLALAACEAPFEPDDGPISAPSRRTSPADSPSSEGAGGHAAAISTDSIAG